GTFTASQLLYGNGTNALSSVATTTFTPSNEFTVGGTIGAFVGGANSTLALSDTTGTLSIAKGGTATTTGGVTNGVEYFNGTNLSNDYNFIYLPNSNIGIGTSSPFSSLSVSTTTPSATTTSLFAVASSTNATLSTVQNKGN